MLLTLRMHNEATMPINLSIRNVPDDVAERLRIRAKQNHRSLQGELLAVVQDAASNEPKRKLSPLELVTEVYALGLKTPSESTRMIREDRDR
jgi:plasmid stability protein